MVHLGCPFRTRSSVRLQRLRTVDPVQTLQSHLNLSRQTSPLGGLFEGCCHSVVFYHLSERIQQQMQFSTRLKTATPFVKTRAMLQKCTVRTGLSSVCRGHTHIYNPACELFPAQEDRACRARKFPQQFCQNGVQLDVTAQNQRTINFPNPSRARWSSGFNPLQFKIPLVSGLFSRVMKVFASRSSIIPDFNIDPFTHREQERWHHGLCKRSTTKQSR